MTLLLTLLLFAAPPDTVASLYAHHDTEGLARLYTTASTVSDDLLYRYRLYPLTDDPRYLADLPDESVCRTARDYALLAALWGYRATDAPLWKQPTYGAHFNRALDRAHTLDPDEPYLLLVEGQSLLYRAGLFGGSAEKALQTFERLRTVLRDRPAPGLSPFEPEVWIWYTLRKLGRPHTDRVRDRLLAENPPPLFRAFLLDPP